MDAEILIEDMINTGEGVGFWQKNKVKVAHAYPGDRVRVSLSKNKKRGFLKGKLEQLLSPAKERIPAICSHANLCGGCKLGQLDYTAQLEYKTKLLKKTFADFSDALLLPIIPSQMWNYRNKMEFTFSENRAGTKFLGLMIASAGKYVFNLTECALASPWMSELLNKVRLFWQNSNLKAFNPLLGSGILRYLTLRETKRTNQKMAVLTILDSALEPFTLENKQALIATVQKTLPKENVHLILRKQKSAKGMPTTFQEEVLLGQSFMQEELWIQNQKLKFKISSSSFFQPNPLQAEKLYSKALELADTSSSYVFDLYAGTGSLGMLFAPFAKEVLCIEENPAAVLDARENFAFNQLKNITIQEGDVGALLAQGVTKPDLVVLDPPRAGLSPLALEQLLFLAPQKILYISCNIETQKRDLLALTKQKYLLKALQPVDQFPQTMHIENIVLLVFKQL